MKQNLTNIFKGILLLTIGIAILSGQNGEKIELKAGDPAPTFYLRDLDNEDFFIRDYCGEELRQPWKHREKHVVILSFFASWCQPCRQEIPLLHEIKDKYKDENLKIYLIDVGEKKDLVRKFVSQQGYKLPILLDIYSMVSAKKYGVYSLPHLFVIDKDGIIALNKTGFHDKESFTQVMDSTLNQVLPEYSSTK